MKEQGEMAIPHLFRCPISLDLFTDPVTLCTGQTYDRSSIETWISAGNQTCPVTMQKLQDPTMVPNHTLRHLIHQWLQMGHHHQSADPNYHPTIINPPDPTIVSLKHNLESHNSTLETRLQALEKVRVLSEDLPTQNSCLIQLGLFPLLVELVFDQGNKSFEEDNLKLVEGALICVLKLMPFSSLSPLNTLLKEESKLVYFAVLLKQGTITIKKSLCKLIEAVPSSPETRDLCAVLGNNPGLVKGIILLLTDSGATSESGIKAISALCSLESNRESLVREGTVEGLLTHVLSVRTHKGKSAAKAIALVELLVLGAEGAKTAVIDHPSGVDALVKMVFRVSDHEGSENALNLLMIACSDSEQARERAVCGGVLTQLLLLLQSQCSGRTKTKARMLLKLLKSM